MRKNDVSIVFNGGIYNFDSLRNDLLDLNHIFQSKSDTEVILSAYLEYGPDAFKRLRGMFAFVLIDERLDKVYVVRDA